MNRGSSAQARDDLDDDDGQLMIGFSGVIGEDYGWFQVPNVLVDGVIGDVSLEATVAYVLVCRQQFGGRGLPRARMNDAVFTRAGIKNPSAAFQELLDIGVIEPHRDGGYQLVVQDE